ncbi:hypothetical protein EV421DRAFT_1907433 [Armillaria borealis]|uniref:Uncharacterized protein n=1 Tax=Armillaria borealis TaxID=47425 RepID=A0AA39MKN2_9AGAR|nr:hypothetical protein EV421DRAFT_1907433 [Armillaria borealis]
MSPYCQLGNFLFDACDTVAHFRTSSVTAHKAAYKAKVDNLPLLEPTEKEIRRLEEVESHLAEQLGMTGDFDHVDVFNHVVRRGDLELAKQLTELHRLRLEGAKAEERFDVHITSRPFPSGPSHLVRASRFWAVLIGIDRYECNPLRGERIQLLLGSKEHTSPDDPMYPSRTHITDMLFSLIDNPEIEERDNIIIYFSGHGSAYSCSSYHDVEKPDLETEISFSGTGYIEALCPIDRDNCDTNGKPVPDISDREFNTILTLIS